MVAGIVGGRREHAARQHLAQVRLRRAAARALELALLASQRSMNAPSSVGTSRVRVAVFASASKVCGGRGRGGRPRRAPRLRRAARRRRAEPSSATPDAGRERGRRQQEEEGRPPSSDLPRVVIGAADYRSYEWAHRAQVPACQARVSRGASPKAAQGEGGTTAPTGDEDQEDQEDERDRGRLPTRRCSASRPGDKRDDAEALEADAIEPPAARGALTPARNQVERFLAEVRRYPRLSDEDERVLGKAVRESGDREAARKLVVHNLRLVVAIAYQYRRAWANILDLFQEGSVGIMEAVKRWEPTLGPRFGTYAAYWIRAYVLRFLMTNSRLIHVGNTRAGRKLFYPPREGAAEARRGRLRADAQAARREARRQRGGRRRGEPAPRLARGVVRSARAPSAATRAGCRSPRRSRAATARPRAEAAGAELASAVRRFMTAFQSGLTDEREKVVWREHLAADEPAPLGELGARFGVSKQRMGQIADRLKKRFREEIVRELGPDVKTVWQ